MNDIHTLNSESRGDSTIQPDLEQTVTRTKRRSLRNLMLGDKSTRRGVRRRLKLKTRAQKVAAGTLVAVVALSGAAVATSSAQAATTGAGIHGVTPYGGDLVNYIAPDGTRGYCTDSSLDWPSGATDDGTITDSFTSAGGRVLSSDNIKFMNYALLKYGQTADDYQAGAVAALIYAFTSTHADNVGHGKDVGSYYINGDAQLQVRYDAIWDDVMAHYLDGGTATGGSGSADLTVDSTNNYLGTVSINLSPADAVAAITLTNGVFEDGTSSKSGVTNGAVYNVVGVSNANGDPYKIAVNGTGEFSQPGTGVDSNWTVYNTPGAQRIVAGGTMSSATTGRFEFSSLDPAFRSTDFSPMVTTQVSSQIVQRGQQFEDVLTFSVATPASGPTNQWFTNPANGNHAPIVATGTLYGPSPVPFAESAAAPAGVPVAASGITVNTGTTGPKTTYTANAGITAEETGYYNWVWEIRASDQIASVQNVLPDGYVFTDRFGLVSETSTVQFQPAATSKVTEAIVAPGDSVSDTLAVSSGEYTWPEGVDVVFSGTAYSVAAGSNPPTSAAVPAGTAVIGTTTITANAAGTYTSPEVGPVPNDAGYVVWVWTMKGAEQSAVVRPFIIGDWTDSFGLDDETSVVQFQPNVTTVVSTKIVKKGDPFIDTLQFGTSSGQWLAGTDVVAEGTLYGPTAFQPDESATVPSWARVAGTQTMTASGVGNYVTDGSIVADEAGYYTWVWKIVKYAQSEETQALIVRDFTDNFGQVPETHVSSSNIYAVSAVTEPEVALSGEITDTLEVFVKDGAWLQDGSKRVPVTFRGTAYFVTGEQPPVVSDTVPASAVVLGSTTIVATKPGTYTSEPLTAIDVGVGYVSWVWEIRDEDQPEQYRGFALDWADQFGLVNETQKVLQPKIVTKAQPLGAPGETMTDTAVITGTLPATPSELHFEVYAATLDENGQPVCATGNLIEKTTSTTTTKAGEYVSPEVIAPGYGDFWWVEVLTSDKGNTIVKGLCGIPNETTTVTPPKVKTEAVEFAPLHGTATDTATVDGYLPSGATLIFEVYRQPQVGDVVVDEAGQPVVDADGKPVLLTAADIKADQPICEATNLVGSTVGEPVEVKFGANDSKEYTSPEVYLGTDGKFYWIETLLGEEGDVLHRGECGAPGETTTVEKPVVTTKAVDKINVGESAHDVAIVTGLIPQSGFTAEITFEAFKQDTAQPVCTTATRVFDTIKTPIVITEAGEYQSASVKFDKPGTYYWVETLTYVGQESGERIVIHRGVCGEPDETTKVTAAVLGQTGANGSLTIGLLSSALVVLLLGIGFFLVARRRTPASMKEIA